MWSLSEHSGDRSLAGRVINDQGTVTEKNWAGITIQWDNRTEQAILHNDMVQVERCHENNVKGATPCKIGMDRNLYG